MCRICLLESGIFFQRRFQSFQTKAEVRCCNFLAQIQNFCILNEIFRSILLCKCRNRLTNIGIDLFKEICVYFYKRLIALILCDKFILYKIKSENILTSMFKQVSIFFFRVPKREQMRFRNKLFLCLSFCSSNLFLFPNVYNVGHSAVLSKHDSVCDRKHFVPIRGKAVNILGIII